MWGGCVIFFQTGYEANTKACFLFQGTILQVSTKNYTDKQNAWQIVLDTIKASKYLHCPSDKRTILFAIMFLLKISIQL